MSNKPTRTALDLLNQSTTPGRSSTEALGGSLAAPSMPGGRLRGVIDALVQGALVELFQAYDVALAPLPRAPRGDPAQQPDLSAVIGFSAARDGKSANTSGKLSLSVPSALFDVMRRDTVHLGRTADWMRELANQLMGRFKNRLLPYGAKLQMGLPSSIGREALDAQLARADNLRLYRGRTLRGEVIATLEGTLKESELVYVGSNESNVPATEGELILF